jgi:3,4-dihydroxy 2-butanone 4-phosphate synthase / GTP cyclohydrolase II
LGSEAGPSVAGTLRMDRETHSFLGPARKLSGRDGISPSQLLSSSSYRLAVEALARGECVILLDEALGNADFIAVAELVTSQTIAFMAIHGRGLIALALPAARVDELRLPPMSRGWGHPNSATVSIEAREGVSTGISAGDRARTIGVAVDPTCGADDLVLPGHVFPLRVEDNESALKLLRPNRADVALALARSAGFGRGAVLCEILDEAGDRADAVYLQNTAARWRITQVTFAELGY